MSTPRVRQILDALQTDGWVNAEWAHTGGGCFALRVPLGNFAVSDWTEIMITGDDVFIHTDLENDDNLDGFWFVGGYDKDGELVLEEGLRDSEIPWETMVPRIVETVNSHARVLRAGPVTDDEVLRLPE